MVIFRNSSIGIFSPKLRINLCSVKTLTGEGIVNSMISFCVSTGLDLNNIVGLGLDCASAMSGKFKGVQARIRELYPMNHYTPCSSRSLNLAIGKANTVSWLPFARR